MFNINNINGVGNPSFNCTQNKPAVPAKTQVEKDAQKAPSTDKIMFDVPVQAPAQSVELSEAAQNYLAELKEKYGDYDFVIADFETDEEAQELLSQGDGTVNVLITPDLLEKMAADEATRTEYEAMISGAEEQFDQIKEQIGDNAELVDKLGISFGDDGEVSYYASLKGTGKNSEGTCKIVAETIEALAEKINEIAEKRKENKEAEKPEEKDSTMPPKSFEKYRKEEDPYATEKDYGTLPPESFKKYEKEETIYDTDEDYGTLPPESFKKYEKEKTIYDTDEDYGTLPPESFKKYEKEESVYVKEEDYGTMPPKSFQKYLTEDQSARTSDVNVSFTV